MSMFDEVLEKIRSHPDTVDDINTWLFVTVNTMKAILDNSCKEDIGIVHKAAEYSSTSELQRMYDVIQGKYGREGFSYRNNPEYYYLSSLVARYPEAALSDEERRLISDYCDCTDYLMYNLKFGAVE